VLALAAGACGLDAPPAGGDAPDHLHSDRGGIGVLQQALAPTAVDVRRSLAVTDQVITSTFALQAVLDQLAAQSGVAGLTGLQLFTQLWDTQNVASIGVTSGPHCDDQGGTLNGFPYQCRRAEGAQAFNAAAEITNYSLIGLYNRFELASPSGADCGEHRMVFGRTAGGGRAFIIFEAVLPNPTPILGLEGCRPVASFWAGLSTNNDAASRATALHEFYFTGLPGFSPVIHIDNYGNTGLSGPTGQVRINEFMQLPWMLREFKLQKVSATSVLFVPVTAKTNPFGDLFSPTSTNSQAAAFQDVFFPSQVAALAVNDINLFNYVVPDNFNTGESNPQNFGGVDDYLARFSPTSQLATNIQEQLTAIGSTLTPANIVARAEALSCAGCHQLSTGAALGGGLANWPSSTGFVQSSELTENGPDGARFVISPALTDVFLPHRAKVLQTFLDRLPSASDYDGDRRADLGVYRPFTRTFNILTSASNFTALTTKTLGLAGDVPIGSADYDGDGKSDMAIFRPSDGTWTILTSSSGFTGSIVKTWGLSGDIPLSGADYDGDGTADITVFRPSDGTWNILTSSSDFTQAIIKKFGVSTDQPLGGADYDGDSKADLVIWRRGPQTMNVLLSSSQTLLQRALAVAFSDVAVTGSDFDGDGKADMATWSPTTFQWLVRTSTSNWQTSIQATWGETGDTPLAGTDFDGDGRSDFVVFRPSIGTWNVLLSSSNFTTSLVKKFGTSTDRPLGH
jgi:hypothetical protein